MKRKTCITLSMAAALFLTVAAFAEAASSPELSSNPAPKGPDAGSVVEAERPLTLVVDGLQQVSPPDTNVVAAEAAALGLPPPSAEEDAVILLPEFVVRDEAGAARRARMMEQLAQDLQRLVQEEKFDPVRGGTVAVADFGNARLTLGNDDKRPGFSLLNLEF
ncbi:MAG TPA: hypothetical protein VGA56_05585 [Opitutaceae bacterium]